MILQKLKQKISTLGKLLKFIYSNYTAPAVLRDILFIISTAAEIYGITILGKFIDETTQILLNWKEFDIRGYFGTESFLYLSIILVLWIVIQIGVQFREFLYHVIFENIWRDAEGTIISKVSSSNLEDVEKEEYQNMLTFVPAFSITRMTSAYENFSSILSNVIRFITAGIILFGTMGWTVLLLLVFVLPETVATHLRRRQIKKYQDDEVGKLKYLNYINSLSLAISNFLELRVNNIYSYLKRKYSKGYEEYVDGYLKTQFNFYQDKTLFSIVGQLFKFAYVIYLLSFAIVKGLTFGTFKALYDYVDVVYSSIFNIFNSLSLMSNNLAYVDEFFELAEYEGFGDYEHGKEKLGTDTPKIEFKNLDFQYPDDPETKVLKKLNIEVNPGEKVAFFGGDGSGKSTTVKILTGLYRVNSGEYLIDGHSVKDLDRGELKKRLSVTFQDFINYHFSLKENIVISGQRKNIDNDLYGKVSKIAGVDDFKKSINIEDSDILGKTFPSGKDLSPGYWQRLAIARMLYRNKKIFLMDEPFTYIDDMSASKILKDMFDFIGEDRSMVYITRSSKHLDRFDRIYYFDKGKIVESGTWKELMRKKGRMYENINEHKSND
jgi:ABC-type multidrug transport system fused ATPase/permease subunit